MMVNLSKNGEVRVLGNGQFTLPLEHLKVDPADRIFITDGEGNPRYRYSIQTENTLHNLVK